MAPLQSDTISFTGSISREIISLKRNHSICSVHNHGNPAPTRHNVSKISNYHDGSSDRFNKSFNYMRYIVVIFGGLAVGFMSLLRLNITVAILNMVNQTRVYLEENPEANLEEYFGEGYEEAGEFDWDNEIQQLIISYYMIAYTLPQLLTTKLALKVGVKWSIPLCVGLCALSCLLTPLVAHQGWQYVTILRLLNGLGASAILPLMVHVIELWMPASESSLGLAILQTVQAILFTLSPLISGALASIHWKWAFYVPAIAALIFCFLWLCFITDRPGDCWLISQSELNTICGCQANNSSNFVTESPMERRKAAEEKSAGNHRKQSPETDNSSNSGRAIPWTRALKVKSFYALTAVWIFYCSSFGSFSFLVPSYMRQVLKVQVMENGMLCFIIQAGCMISVVWPQPILSLLQTKYGFSLTASRRVIMGFICSIAISTWLLVAKYHQYQVVLFSINRIFHLSTDSIVTSTIMSQYSKTGVSSIVYSVINAVGNFSTVFFCRAAGEFLDISAQSRECWSWIFIAMSIMNAAIFILFSTVISSEPIELDGGETKDNCNSLEEGTIKSIS